MIVERWRRPGLWYVVQRLAAAVVVIFAVVSATFLLAHAIPADPARAAAGLHAGAAQVAAVAQPLGLNRPLWDQYVSYIQGVLHGNLGISYLRRQPIVPQLFSVLPATLELVFTASSYPRCSALSPGCWRRGGHGIPVRTRSEPPRLWGRHFLSSGLH